MLEIPIKARSEVHRDWYPELIRLTAFIRLQREQIIVKHYNHSCASFHYAHMHTSLWWGINYTNRREEKRMFIPHPLYLFLVIFFPPSFLSSFGLSLLSFCKTILHFPSDCSCFFSALLVCLCWHWGPIREKIEWQRCMLMTWKHRSIPHRGGIERERGRERVFENERKW